MANEKLEAAKRRYASGRANELDPDELGRIALIVVGVAVEMRELEIARQHADLAVGHYVEARDERRVVRAKRRLAGALLALQDWATALPLVDEVCAAPEERDMELPRLDDLEDPKARALELARALVAWGSGKLPDWTVVWGALFDAFIDEPIAAELERRFRRRLGRKNADVALKLRNRGFFKAAAQAAGQGTHSTPTSGDEWNELARAQESSGDIAAAYESYRAAAERFAKSFSRTTNTYTDEEVDPDMAIHLRGEDRFNYKGSMALREAASCAFALGDRAKMTAAYDRELLLTARPKERKAFVALQKALTEGRTADALDLLQRELRYWKGGTPEIRGLYAGIVGEHLAAGRLRAAVSVHREILDAIRVNWGESQPVHVAAELDFANLLIDIGCVGEARPLLESVWAALEELDARDDDHPFAEAHARALARVETAKDVELLECVQTARFTTAKERLARIRELLASGASMAATDASGDGMLHHAARLRAADTAWLVRALVDEGASRSVANAAGQRPIEVAAANPAEVADVVEELWEKDGPSALEIAANHGRLVTVARLRALGAGPPPTALSRPFPENAALVEFALRVARATGDSAIVDAAFSGEPPGVEDVRRSLVAFAAHGGRGTMHARFDGPHSEKLIAELLYTIANDEVLETLVREDWSRFASEDLGLLRASLPLEIDDALGDEEELLSELEMAFRGAAFDASPPPIREHARRADFGKPEEAPPPKKARVRR